MIKARYEFEDFKVVVHTNGVEVFLTEYHHPRHGSVYSSDPDYEQWQDDCNEVPVDLNIGYSGE